MFMFDILIIWIIIFIPTCNFTSLVDFSSTLGEIGQPMVVFFFGQDIAVICQISYMTCMWGM